MPATPDLLVDTPTTATASAEVPRMPLLSFESPNTAPASNTNCPDGLPKRPATPDFAVDTPKTPAPFVDLPSTPASKFPDVLRSSPRTPAVPLLDDVLLDLV